MTTRMTYAEKLRHPKWQEKRLRILQRAGFKCEQCGSSEKTLHVHHGHYQRGLDPWEYDDESLRSLCEDCHETAQVELETLHREIALHGPDPAILGYVLGLRLTCSRERLIVFLRGFDEALGFCDALSHSPWFALSPPNPIDLLKFLEAHGTVRPDDGRYAVDRDTMNEFQEWAAERGTTED